MAAPPDGSNQVGYTQDYNLFGGAYLAQVMDGNCGGVSCPGGNSNITLSAGTTYTLTANFGSRVDSNVNVNGFLILQNHGGSVGNLAVTSVTLSPGQWVTATVSYTVPLSSPFIGQPLGIAFASTGNQGEWNNILLSSSTSGASCNGSAGVGCAVKLTQMGLN